MMNLHELEIDITTYTVLVMHQRVDANSIAFLLDFLLMVEDFMRRSLKIMTEAEIDSMYADLFRSQGIHRFLNNHLSQHNSIIVWQEILASFYYDFRSNDQRLISHLRDFAFSENIQTQVKTMKIVITDDSQKLIQFLFSEQSELFRIGICVSLVMASQYYNNRMLLGYPEFTARELFNCYLTIQNEKRLK
jgi:hypothetical protein